jgi:6-phosphogluconate dehydrogenase
MQIGLIGLGRMGLNMGRRWLQAKHEVVAYNRSFEKTQELEKDGAIATQSIEDLVQKLKAPRVVWVMLPAGPATDQHIEGLASLLSKGDIVIDGGNVYFKDDLRHAEILKQKGISFLDAGVSGGIWGLKVGYCTMVGGDRAAFDHVEPLIKSLAPDEGYLYCGGTGAGHFVKMVHNGVEYGLMQAYAEGFEILAASPFKPNLHQVSHIWNRGSVIRSWLLELAEDALSKDPDLSQVGAYVEDSGEGRWTVQQAIDTGVAAPVITLSLFQRFVSRQSEPFGFRMLSALRNQFGGHAVQKPGEKRGSAAGAGGVQPASADRNAKPRGFEDSPREVTPKNQPPKTADR